MGDVVDEDGLVVGADNIHVVDASVFPDLPTTNTYLPTLMLAERLAVRGSSTSSAAHTAASSSSIDSCISSVRRQTSGTSWRSATKPKSRLPL